MAIAGAWTGLEHPADPGTGFPSFFATSEVRLCCQRFTFDMELHQCMYGGFSKKPTGLILPRQALHLRHFLPLQGLDAQGRCHTTAVARYPSQLCHAVAESGVMRLVNVQQKGLCSALPAHNR